MNDHSDVLQRIAIALERLVPAKDSPTDWITAPAYVWEGSAKPVGAVRALPLGMLRAIDSQKQAVTSNVERFAAGHAAHDMLLWGARGMGKSALVRAAVAAAQSDVPARLALVQVASGALNSIPALFSILGPVPRRFVVFVDDLGFESDDSGGPRALRSWLEGGVEARPDNVRLAVTANRRAIVARTLSDQDEPLHPRDDLDDRLALADRFGLSIGFHACSQDDYLAIVAHYCDSYQIIFDPCEALEWAKRRGARSGRTAWQFVTELAGRSGVPLSI